MKVHVRLMTGIAVLLLASQLFSAIATFACIIGPYSEQEAFRDAGSVFVGKVLNITDIQVTNPQTGITCTEHTNHFQVMTSWKGIEYFDTTIDVYSRSDCNGPKINCGPLQTNFQVGEMYLVFALIESGGKLEAEVNSLHYTMPLTEVTNEIKALGSEQVPGQSLVPIVGMPVTGEPTNYYNWLCVFALTCTGGGLVLRRLNPCKAEIL